MRNDLVADSFTSLLESMKTNVEIFAPFLVPTASFLLVNAKIDPNIQFRLISLISNGFEKLKQERKISHINKTVSQKIIKPPLVETRTRKPSLGSARDEAPSSNHEVKSSPSNDPDIDQILIDDVLGDQSSMFSGLSVNPRNQKKPVHRFQKQ
jgi:hypothetical protein